MYKLNTKVKIYNVPSMEGMTGLIKGVSVTPVDGIVGAGAYIIEIDEEFHDMLFEHYEYDYTSITMTDACVKEIDET